MNYCEAQAKIGKDRQGKVTERSLEVSIVVRSGSCRGQQRSAQERGQFGFKKARRPRSVEDRPRETIPRTVGYHLTVSAVTARCKVLIFPC